MSVTSFDDLLNIIQEDLAPCQNYVARDTVSATNKYVHTLRTRALYWTLQYRLSISTRAALARTTGVSRVPPVTRV
nr:unnamed protein product [Callosobruchus chinensis]